MDSGGSLNPLLQIAGQYESEKTGPAFDPSKEKFYFFLNVENLETPLMVLPMK